jgi:hypothetical protein
LVRIDPVAAFRGILAMAGDTSALEQWSDIVTEAHRCRWGGLTADDAGEADAQEGDDEKSGAAEMENHRST